MDQSGKTTTVDWVKAVSWLDVNKKRLITWTVAAVVVVTAIALFIYYENQKEVRASRELSEIPLPLNPSKSLPPEMIQRLLRVEQNHPNTKAAARALAQAAAALFADGQYDEAQKLFARFEKQYPDSSWLPQALMGYAATLEMQNKTSQALEEYEKLRKRYPNDAIADGVKLRLAALYEKQNRPEDALTLYQDILRVNPAGYTSLGAEAGTRQEELLQKYPNLMKTNVPPSGALALSPTNVSVPPRPATNRPQTITLTNLVKRTNPPTTSVQITNRPGTNVPLLIQPTVKTSAPPATAK